MTKKFFGDVELKDGLLLSNFTASRVLQLDGSSNVEVSTVTTTELGHLSGVSSNVQTQLDGKLSNVLNSAQIFVGNASNLAVAVTPGGELSVDNAGSFTLDNNSVIGKLLTGYSAGAGTVAATDSILEAIQKIDGNVQALGFTGLTDNRLLRADGTGAVQDSGITVDDTDNITGVATLTTTGDVTVGGNLTVDGTTTTVNSTNLDVTDKNILVNDGGSTAGSVGAGINIEGDAAAVVGYFRVDESDSSLLELKAPTGNEVVLDVNSDVTVTLGGNLDVEAASAINQDVTSDASPTFAGLTATSDVNLNAQSDLRFFDSDSSQYVALQAATDITTNFTLTLPTTDGSDGDVLQTNGSGELSFGQIGSGGDIQETSFSGAQNATNVSITGFNFSNATVRSFEALVSVEIDATSNLYEVHKLYGIQRDSDWSLSQESTGDDSLVTFAVSSTGQVQYTSGSYAGFNSLEMNFRAITTSI